MLIVPISTDAAFSADIFCVYSRFPASADYLFARECSFNWLTRIPLNTRECFVFQLTSSFMKHYLLVNSAELTTTLAPPLWRYFNFKGCNDHQLSGRTQYKSTQLIRHKNTKTSRSDVWDCSALLIFHPNSIFLHNLHVLQIPWNP